MGSSLTFRTPSVLRCVGMKTEITKKLEKLLERKFNDRNEFFVFECTIGWYGKEIVDCVMYNCNREICCYEIKSSVSDFKSSAAKTFIGNRNYFVMPLDVYEKVKYEIPIGVGVYVAVGGGKEVTKASPIGESVGVEWLPGFYRLHCIQQCRRMDLRADKEVILSSMLRSMQRDVFRGSRFAWLEDEVELDKHPADGANIGF